MRFLKIDRSIVSSVTGLAGAIGITVIAEGVETVAQEQALLDLGCPLGQGYLYGRPDTFDRLRVLAAGDPAPADP